MELVRHTTTQQDKRQVREAVHRLLDEAQQAEKVERRAEVRRPFFYPVSITLDNEQKISAFSREISPLGVGLLHSMEVPVGPVVITIRGESGSTVSLATHIIWCRPCGDGWYLSGGCFLQLISDEG